MAENEFVKYVKSELERVKTVKTGKTDFRDWLVLNVGETVIEVLPIKPRMHPVYSNRVIFRVKKGGTEYDWAVSRGRVYQQLLELLAAGHRKIKVIRVGTGKQDTRYQLIPYEESKGEQK